MIRVREKSVIRAPRAFTLIEVLVALLVLSVGLLGIGALHVQSMTSAHSAYQRSIAATIALDLEERAWIELANTSAGCPAIPSGAAQTHWDSSNPAGRVGLPVLRVTLSAAGVSTSPAWIERRILITWSEARFLDIAGLADQDESFDFVTRIPCRS